MSWYLLIIKHYFVALFWHCHTPPEAKLQHSCHKNAKLTVFAAESLILPLTRVSHISPNERYSIGSTKNREAIGQRAG